MNTPTTSLIGSLGLALAGMIVGWLASHNIIPAADVSADTALIGTIIVAALGSVVVWFKMRMATASAHVDAVNSDAIPGVKVVSTNTPGTPVTIDSAGAVKPISAPKGT